MTNTVRFHFCMVAKAMTLIKADSRVAPVKTQEKNRNEERLSSGYRDSDTQVKHEESFLV